MNCANCGLGKEAHVEYLTDLACPHETWPKVANTQGKVWTPEDEAEASDGDYNLDGEPKVDIDDVNHPAHYTSHPSGVECIAIAEHMPFCIGNAMKYLFRHGLKSGVSSHTDLKKAIWYIEREIARTGDK